MPMISKDDAMVALSKATPMRPTMNPGAHWLHPPPRRKPVLNFTPVRDRSPEERGSRNKPYACGKPIAKVEVPYQLLRADQVAPEQTGFFVSALGATPKGPKSPDFYNKTL